VVRIGNGVGVRLAGGTATIAQRFAHQQRASQPGGRLYHIARTASSRTPVIIGSCSTSCSKIKI